MKKVIFGLLAAAFAAAAAFGIISGYGVTAFADEGNIDIDGSFFPDDNFRQFIFDNIDDGDGILTRDEIASVTDMDVSGCGISDLAGIKYFTSLRRLDCCDNQLTSLDVSNNEAFEELYCNDNQLADLDVSRNDVLNVLVCLNNPLKKIYLRKEASEYDIFLCDDGVEIVILDEGDVMVNLTNFPDQNFRNYLFGNICDHDKLLTRDEIASVTDMDVSGCGISDLAGIEYFTSLETLNCSNNLLTSLDVSKNTALKELLCDGNDLTDLDLSLNDTLKVVNCSNNSLEKIYLPKETTKYDRFECDDGVEIVILDEGDVMVNLTNFPDQNFRNFLFSNIGDHDKFLTRDEIASVTDMYVSRCGISDLNGIEYFTSLRGLNCSFNQLTSLDVSKNTVLEKLDCSFNQLTSLDVSKNTILEILNCNSNKLTELKLYNCSTTLKDLNYGHNNLDFVDVSGFPGLQSLDCSANHLSGLNLCNNTQLERLDCNNCQLTVLDVSCCTALKDLYCYDNKLTTLDVSKNTSLTNLGCFTNQLTSLDVSKNTALKNLACDDNQLTSLDVSKNIALTDLNCGNNQLTSLDVSNNTALTNLRCNSNQLTSLDVSKNIVLSILDCTNNPLNEVYLAKTADEYGEFYRDGNVKIIVLTPSDWTCRVEWDINDADPSKTSATALFECTKEGATDYKESVPMTVKVISVDATCEIGGGTYYEATLPAEQSRTGKTITELEALEITTSATGHSWGDWEVTKEPTVDSEGEETRVCKNDPSHKETRILVKLTPTPTATPTVTPTVAPTVTPTAVPTVAPTVTPTNAPTAKPTNKPAVNVSLTLNKKDLTVVCGKKDSLKATLKGASSKITWKSSDTKIATVDASGKITTKQAGTVTVTATAAGKSASCVVTVLYKDVTNTKDFWYTPTNYLSSKGVVKGYDKQTLFKPANDCTRAQMLTFMWRLQGEPTPKASSCKFPDVKKTDYFFKPVIWAVEQGITTGYKDGTFKPQNVCTRAQTVTFLWRMAKTPKPGTSKNPFSDVKTGDYFYKAVLWASGKKIVAGYSDGTFKPQGKCLRRQMVTFLYKFDKAVNAK